MHSRDISSPSPTFDHSKYSISNQDLESRGFSLHRTMSGLNIDYLKSLCTEVGFEWPNPAKKIKLGLERSQSVVWIENKATQKPVAFGRAIGDGVFNATIWDVVVDPSFHKKGLGKAVMECMVQDLLDKGITDIALLSAKKTIEFYKRLGFVAKDGGLQLRAMVWKRKQSEEETE